MILLALLAALLVQPPPPADALATVTAARAQATWSAQYATMTAPTATPIPTVTPTPTATPRPTATMTPTPAASATVQPTWTPQAPIIIVPTVVVNVERVETIPTVDNLPDWAIVALGILVIVLIGSGLLIIVRNDR